MWSISTKNKNNSEEIFYSRFLFSFERHYTKDEIITQYLNFDPPNLINSLLTKFFEFIFSLKIEDFNLNLDEKLNFINNFNLYLFKRVSLFN